MTTVKHPATLYVSAPFSLLFSSTSRRLVQSRGGGGCCVIVIRDSEMAPRLLESELTTDLPWRKLSSTEASFALGVMSSQRKPSPRISA